MAWRLLRIGLLAATLPPGLAAGPALPAAVGAGQAACAAPTTVAAVEAEHRRQRQLCLPLLVVAVRAECLRQADRSLAQALAQLAPASAARPAIPAERR